MCVSGLADLRGVDFSPRVCVISCRNRMAAVAACKRVGKLGRNSGIGGFGGYGASQVLSPASRYADLDCRQISQLVKSNGKRLFLVDTLALVIPVISLCSSISEVSFPCSVVWLLRKYVLGLTIFTLLGNQIG